MKTTMEVPMLYKTIVLELLQQVEEIYSLLLRRRTMMPTLDRYAVELKDIHQAWIDRLTRQSPAGDTTLLGSEALELAIRDVQNRLRIEFQPDDGTSFLDGAIANGRNPTPIA
jgi:hypothetical protein